MRSVISFLRQRPGLCLLIGLLGILWITSLRPGFFLVGWDNFSSYFNLWGNIPRTFFATWRAYRGLGVASDSEVTDVFRQVFYFLLAPVVGESLVDQIYLLSALSTGLIAMYFLARELFGERKADLFGFFASFFYLCNLNTAATFSFPMIMYTNRFFSLPLLFLLFVLLLKHKHVSLKTYLAFVIAIFFISGSYITATILITVVIALFLFGMFQANKRRFLLVLLFYLLCNAFWLFPFANYTVQKSSIIRLAPNFIEANEIQLNKPKSFYDIRKQLTLYHNFFDTEFSHTESLQKFRFVTLAELYGEPFYQGVLWIFPILYLSGSLILLVYYRKRKELWWIPAVLFSFLFLSLKEFSPLGFVYMFLDSFNPFFGVLFRFGDTKFHAFIAFSGSLAAAVAILFIIEHIKRIRKAVIILLVLLTIFVYKDYFTGRLVGPFIYNKIPQAYEEMAAIINGDPDNFRVLHLPFDETAYWKSYSWGAFGSSFFHFMIDKPLIDKAFEPASMENAYLHREITALFKNMQLVESGEEKQERAKEFAALLQKVGIKYIIVDETVQTAVYARGMVLWGKFPTPDVLAMMQVLRSEGLVTEVRRFPITLTDYAQAYQPWYPLSPHDKELLSQNKHTSITLFALADFAPKITFLQSVRTVDASIDNLLETSPIRENNHWMQKKGEGTPLFFPLQHRASELAEEDKQFSLVLDRATLPAKKAQMYLPGPSKTPRAVSTRYVDIYAKKINGAVTISFYHRYTPTIAGNVVLEKIKEMQLPATTVSSVPYLTTPLDAYLSDWSILPGKTAGSLRLRINNYVLPLPHDIAPEEMYVATAAVAGESVPLEVKAFTQRWIADPSQFTLTDAPNCFFDGLENASYAIFPEKKTFRIQSKNQSTCVFYNLAPYLSKNPPHIEVHIRLSGTSKDLDSRYGLSFASTAKPKLKQFITASPKPNAVRVCIKEPFTDDCYNLHQFFTVSNDTSVVFPLERPLEENQDMRMLLSVKNTGYQEQDITIKELAFDEFATLATDTLTFPKGQDFSMTIPIEQRFLSSVAFPKALSQYSFFFNPEKEVLYGQNAACDKKDGYRTYRMVGQTTVSYIENCSIELFQKVPFTSDNFLFWSLGYNLLSGKYPKFIVDDKFYSYVNEYLSLYQGYPDVAGFKLFQRPEEFFMPREKSTIEEGFKNLSFQTTYGYLVPQPGLGDNGGKKFVLHQDGENEGVMAISSFSVQPLPTQWFGFSLSADNSLEIYSVPGEYRFGKILPSLWKVDITSPGKDSQLLFFNEGYDAQWQLYSSWWGMVTGLEKGISPQRCDGFANCFIIKNQSASNTYYIFYTPERLSVLGWIVTLVTIIVFGGIFARRKHLHESSS